MVSSLVPLPTDRSAAMVLPPQAAVPTDPTWTERIECRVDEQCRNGPVREALERARLCGLGSDQAVAEALHLPGVGRITVHRLRQGQFAGMAVAKVDGVRRALGADRWGPARREVIHLREVANATWRSGFGSSLISTYREGAMSPGRPRREKRGRRGRGPDG